jgi:hypothetical protein
VQNSFFFSRSLRNIQRLICKLQNIFWIDAALLPNGTAYAVACSPFILSENYRLINEKPGILMRDL